MNDFLELTQGLVETQLPNANSIWFENINGSVTGKTKENYKSLFSYLDSIEAEHIE